MTGIRVDGKKPQRTTTSPPSTVVHTSDVSDVHTPQMQYPNDWHYAGDACAAKRATGSGYQGDIHHNITTSSSNSNDYACGRGLGKW